MQSKLKSMRCVCDMIESLNQSLHYLKFIGYHGDDINRRYKVCLVAS